MKTIFYLLLLLIFQGASAQLVINEVATTNKNTVQDEDGDNPDWIEIYNAGPAINLAGYALSDQNNGTGHWKFADTTIETGEHLLVYASGKNRNYLGEPATDIDHWETAVFEDDTWQYKNGNSAPGAGWNDVGFAGVWSTGQGGFGYGDGDDNTVTTSGKSYYYRISFDISDKSKILKTILSMDYDDGYIAYINGVEVSRKNLTGTPTYSTYANYWHEALMYLGYHPIEIELDAALMESTLVNGENVLAVEMHQYASFADDATGRTWLHFAISTPEIFFSPNPAFFNNPGTATQLHTDFSINNGESVYLFNAAGTVIDSAENIQLQAGHVKARIPDGGSWCFSDTPSPAAANTGTCYSGYASAPVLSPTPGFYTSAVSATLTGGEMYYTTDGSYPDITDNSYTAPVIIAASGVIKAVQMEAGKLPSEAVGGTYLINELTTLPVVSVIADPCDLFDEGATCPGAYDNAMGWFNHNPKVRVTAEYYDAAHTRQFINDFKFEVVGNYSISLPQKSMRFVIDEDYGSGAEITYNTFEHDKPGLSRVHGFRVRNMDQDYYGTRMKDITINRIGLPTHSISTGYQVCAVFINGEYWGEYANREEMDEYFLRDNFGVAADKVDMIKTGWGGEEKTVTEVGSDTAYNHMIDFITNNDMSVPANYAAAKQMADVENWVDYFSTRIFCDDGEWLDYLENNIRLFRSYEPDIKWRYILWDCTNSQFYAGDNMLSASLNNPWNSVYADMFNDLLENTEFHDYFINRFADLINYIFTVDNNEAILDDLKNEMGPEIAAQNIRWGSGNYAAWNSNVNSLYNFYDSRNSNQRNHINSYFGLDGQVNITLDVNPPGAGLVKISTIVPSTLPWTGVYFNGVPVQLTAIANPGYTFSNWTDNAFITDPSNITFTNNITTTTTFTANFTGAAIANPIVISEVNYNSDSTRNSGDWIELNNTSAVAIDVSSYIVQGKYFYSNFEIPSATIIPANGYLVLAEDTAAFHTQNPFVSNVVGDFHFSYYNDGDTITLKDLQGNTVQAFRFGDTRPWPFTADGYGRTMERKGVFLDPKLPGSWFEGCVSGSPGTAFDPCFEDPLVDEINYHSLATEDAGDWFELYNYGSTTVDLSNWQIKNKIGNTFLIPSGTSLPADDYLVFYEDDTKFTSQFPTVLNKIGPADLNFNGTGDVILIYDQTGTLYQSVGFDDMSPYPLAPDGGGYTLQIVNVINNMNDPLNWMSGCPEGSPGTAYVFPCADAIESVSSDGQLFLYPNPATDVVTISVPESLNGLANIFIYDVSGKEMLSEAIALPGHPYFNIAGFNPGIYYVKMVLGDKNYMQVLVKTGN